MGEVADVAIVGEVELSERVIEAALAVHAELGPGLLESTYRDCLLLELEARGLRAEREVAVPVRYRGRVLGKAFRVDVLVEGRLVVEVKAVEVVLGVHRAQVLTYLRLTGLGVGLLLNFNGVRMKDGIRRVLNVRSR